MQLLTSPKKNKNDYGRISSAHIIPFGDSQDIISFHRFIVTWVILLYASLLWKSANTRNLWLGMPEPLSETDVLANQNLEICYTQTQMCTKQII